MSEYTIRKARTEDLETIARLQQANHHKNMPDADKQKEGFISVETDMTTLQRINKDPGIIVAEADGKVIGYELPLKANEARNIPILVPFVERIIKIKYAGKEVKSSR
jgi:hypothetical protein